ncbi:helix-turn-helix domain-containing protein [Segatella maculosa]|uniref:helix-turn-helix domain-containing protein n=1 Tax=Segatella maculosa TaxID=439703 RepID=UPI0029F4FC7D|nr:helix-turn-helix domain-containing protein [Segatella maculosa]
MQKGGEHSSPSLRLINFVLHMYKQLTSEQRYTISVLLQKKCSLSFIAKTIGVCVSTVSREKRRNSNVQGVYDGRLATLKARCRKATQREWAARKDHNHGQRDGVCST